MITDSQKIQQVEDALDGKETSFGMEMEMDWVSEDGSEKVSLTSRRIGGPDPSLPLEELERHTDIARTRYLYAIKMKNHWANEEYKRSNEFAEATLTYNQKKYKITEKELADKWSQNASGVFEKKDKK